MQWSNGRLFASHSGILGLILWFIAEARDHTLLESGSEWPKDQALLLTMVSYSKKYIKIKI